MDAQSLTQLSQTSAEAQMRALEIALQIIILSIVVLFATTVVIIVWLCLDELRQARPGNPRVQEVENENTRIPVSIDPHTGNSGIYSCARAFSAWYATWARRVFFRSR